MSRGTLIAVVGPSGAGKDTLIDAALAARPDIVRAVRTITRKAAPQTEDFESLSPGAFLTEKAQAAFALDWSAHGLSYGIRHERLAALAEGRHALVNLSRTMIGQARAQFPPCRVIVVEAPVAVLASRLSARGRELASDIEARLRRAQPTPPVGADCVHIDNGGTPEAGIAAFLAALPPALISPPTGSVR